MGHARVLEPNPDLGLLVLQTRYQGREVFVWVIEQW